MRRRRKEAPNTAQRWLLPLEQSAGEDAAARQADRRRPRFIDDSPGHLFLGNQRLDQYLEERDLGWVVRLRRELEALDYAKLEARYQRTGRRPFHPRTLLGLIVYGILAGQWSLRTLESLAKRDVGAWWICGGQQPDHSTIGEFIQRHAEELTLTFVRELVQGLVRRMKLQPGVVAIDGTVIEAAASGYRRLTTEAAQAAAAQAREVAAASPDDARVQADAARAEEAAQAAAERTARRTRQGKAGDTVVVSPREPQAVLQPRKDGVRRFAYKPSTLVHESGLILGQALHPSSETAVVEQLMEEHAAVFGTEPPATLLDAGYCQTAVLQRMVERNANVLCPSGRTHEGEDWEKKGHHGRFGKARFTYDPARDVYTCPAGAQLERGAPTRDRMGRRYHEYTTRTCGGCSLRPQCTTSRRGRRIKRYEGDELKEAMALVLRQPAARAVYRHRPAIAERPFAELRERHGLQRFHRCGTRGAGVEFALHIIAFDLKWAITHRPAAGSRRPNGIVVVLCARVGAVTDPWRLLLVRIVIPFLC